MPGRAGSWVSTDGSPSLQLAALSPDRCLCDGGLPLSDLPNRHLDRATHRPVLPGMDWLDSLRLHLEIA